jgi:hypothetical protein
MGKMSAGYRRSEHPRACQSSCPAADPHTTHAVESNPLSSMLLRKATHSAATAPVGHGVPSVLRDHLAMGELDTVRTASCHVLRRMAPASATINTVVTLRSHHDLSPAEAPAMRVGWAVIART